MKEIYIVLSQTGSVVCKMLEMFTRDDYNHVSLSLDSNLDIMFSFGRLYTYFPWIGGFVEESPHFGTLKRFSETEVRVLAIAVSEKVFNEISEELNKMFSQKSQYHYDSIGVICAAFNRIYRRKNYYYCSEFVREVLVKFGAVNPELFPKIVRPINFLDIPDANVIYCGKLREFASTVNT